VETFTPSLVCRAPGAGEELATLRLERVRLAGNTAADRGGGVHVAAGSLEMKVRVGWREGVLLCRCCAALLRCCCCCRA
jgi:hypothetical protein